MDSFLDVESIFHAAVGIHSKEALEAYLSERCPNSEVRRQVERLLKADAVSDSVLVDPPTALPDIASRLSWAIQIGTRIGRYKILEKINEGGMGVVYVAEQESPIRRKVALKLIKPGMDTKEVIGRFEAERQALAVVEHPNIAGVYDAGVTEQGRPYFVMELVRGIPITQYCVQACAPLRERLRLFCHVCDAIQHAHQKGIIHRDLKPANVLVTQINGKPVIKVIDFGLAKAVNSQRLTEKTVYTGFMRLMGTPAYMSPEQAGVSGQDVDTRSDIYSLGVLLYELLTGTTPLASAELAARSYDEVCQMIREFTPPRPSLRVTTLQNAKGSTLADRRFIASHRLSQALDGDLDRVVLKALDKDRERRYQSPLEFAADVSRYLNGEAVLAVGPSPVYLLRKYAQRHRTLLVMIASIGLLLVATTAVSTTLAIQARRAEQRERSAKLEAEIEKENAERERDRVLQIQRQLDEETQHRRHVAYAIDMREAEDALRRNNFGSVRTLLDRHRPAASQEDLRGWEWRYLWQQSQADPHDVLARHSRPVTSISSSQDGQYLAVGGGKALTVWDTFQRKQIAQWTGDHVKFSPTQPLLAYWGHQDQTEDSPSNAGIHLWDLDTREEVAVISCGWDVEGIEFSRDGRTLAVLTRTVGEVKQTQVTLWNVHTQEVERTFDVELRYHFRKGYPFALTTDAGFAAYGFGGEDHAAVKLLNLETGESVWTFPIPLGQSVVSLAISPDDRHLAVTFGPASSDVQILDLASGRQLGQLHGHASYVRDLQFLADGTLASASNDQTIRLWNLDNLEHDPEILLLKGHAAEVNCLAVSPYAKVISGCADGNVFAWHGAINSARENSHFRIDASSWWDWTVTPDQSAIISCNRDGTVSKWTGECYQNEQVWLNDLGDNFYGSCVTDDGTKVAVGYTNGEVRIWDVARKAVVPPQIKEPEGKLLPTEFYDQGRMLAVMHDGWWGTKFLWDLSANVKLQTWSHTDNLLSHDARTYVDVRGESITVKDFDTGAEESLPATWSTQFPYGQVALSRDARYFARTEGSELLVWDRVERQARAPFGRFMLGAVSVGFSLDGQRLVAGGNAFEAIKIWDFSSGQELLTLSAERVPMRYVKFTPDGNMLCARDTTSVLHCWRAPSWREIEAQTVKEVESQPLAAP